MANDTTATKALTAGLLGAALTAAMALQAAADGGFTRDELVRVGLTFLVAALGTAVTYFVPNTAKTPTTTTTDPAPAPMPSPVSAETSTETVETDAPPLLTGQQAPTA